jgi:hypothetical protein
MAQVPHSDTADAVLLGLAYCQLGGERSGNLAKAIMAINLRGAGGLTDDLRPGRREDQPLLDLTNVLYDSNEAMGIVPCQVIIGQVLRHYPAMLLWGAGSAEEMKGDLLQLFTPERRHWVPSSLDFVLSNGRTILLNARAHNCGRIGEVLTGSSEYLHQNIFRFIILLSTKRFVYVKHKKTLGYF